MAARAAAMAARPNSADSRGALTFCQHCAGRGRRLSGDDLRALRTPFLPGGVWFMLACYGAGTPLKASSITGWPRVATGSMTRARWVPALAARAGPASARFASPLSPPCRRLRSLSRRTFGPHRPPRSRLVLQLRRWSRVRRNRARARRLRSLRDTSSAHSCAGARRLGPDHAPAQAPAAPSRACCVATMPSDGPSFSPAMAGARPRPIPSAVRRLIWPCVATG